MLTSTISSKGQVTVPKKIRDFLKVGASDRLIFIPLDDGKVLITSQENPVTSLFGMLGHRKQESPVSLKEMDSAIKKRRARRGV